MFPISDTAPRRGFPIVNWLIIAVNVVVFLTELTAPDSELFIFQNAFVPNRFSFLDSSTYTPLLYSLFMHGGWLHLLSNMWFLYIFGDNIESYMGHVPYLFFYLIGGVISLLIQYLISPASAIPMIGASGAIAAVAGAYFVLFRTERIKTLLFIFIFVTVVELPVWLFLGYWFALQLFNGFGSLVSYDLNQGGIAWFAHAGGFIYGWWAVRNWLRRPV